MSTLLERNWIPLDSSSNFQCCGVLVFPLFAILWCLLQEEARLRTLASTSTLCTDSSLSLSSGPTSGYNSSNTATYTATNFSSQEGQVRNHCCVRLMSADAPSTEAWCRNRDGFGGDVSVTAMKQDKFALPVHRWATWGEGAFCHVIAKDDDTYFLVNFFFLKKFIDKKSDRYYACVTIRDLSNILETGLFLW